MSIQLFIPINPVPASRPRVSKWGTYYGKKHTAYKAECLAWLAEQPMPDELFEGPLSAELEFRVSRPKTTKLEHPKPDIDNYIKLPLDCITSDGRLWVDDTQIVHIRATKLWCDEEDAGTHVHVTKVR